MSSPAPGAPTPQTEYVTRGRPTSRQRRFVVPLAAVLGLGALAATALHLDRVPAEKEAVGACAEQAVGAVGRAEDRLAAVASYIAPRMGAGARIDESLLALVEEQAAAVAGPVATARADCADLDLSPLSTGRRETRAAYVAALDAQLARLGRISRDGAALFAGHEDVQALLDRAARSR